jgi:hypothetical protein
MTGIERFNQLRAQKGPVEDAAVDALFDSLDVFQTNELHSRWKGGDFDTGHWGTAALKEMRWFGKWFRSDLDASPAEFPAAYV